MKRLSLFALCTVLPLAGCAQHGPDPRDLLETAASAHQQLDSADVSFFLSLDGKAGEPFGQLDVRGNGTVREGGRRTAVNFSAEGELQSVPVAIGGDLVSYDGDTFLRLSDVRLAGGGALPLPQINGLLNRWWLLPSSKRKVDNEPDPSVIPMQLRALDVIHDGGIVIRDGIETRELHVRLNRQRMAEFLRQVAEQRGESDQNVGAEQYDAEGTVWIRLDESLLYDAEWTLKALDLSRPDVHVVLHLRNPHAGSDVVKPEAAFPLLPGVQPFDMFLHGIGAPSPDTIVPASDERP